jgi:hypothetical protein
MSISQLPSPSSVSLSHRAAANKGWNLPRPITSDRCSDILVHSKDPWEDASPRRRSALRRLARDRRVFYIEPIRHQALSTTDFDVSCRGDGLFVVTPYLPHRMAPAVAERERQKLMGAIASTFRIRTTD